MADCQTLYATRINSQVETVVETVTQTLTTGGNAVTSVQPIVVTTCPPNDTAAADCSMSTSYQTFVNSGQPQVQTNVIYNTVYSTQYQTNVEATATRCAAVPPTTQSPSQPITTASSLIRTTSKTIINSPSISSTPNLIAVSSSSSSTSTSPSSSALGFSTHLTTALVIVTASNGQLSSSTQVSQMLVPQVDSLASPQHETGLIVGGTIGALLGCLLVVGLIFGFLKGVGPCSRLRRNDDDGIDDAIWMPPDHERDDDDVKVHPPQRTLSYRSHSSDEMQQTTLGRQSSFGVPQRQMSQIYEHQEWHNNWQADPNLPLRTHHSYIGPLPPNRPLSMAGVTRPMSSASSIYGCEPAPHTDSVYDGMMDTLCRPTSAEVSYQRVSRRFSTQPQALRLTMPNQHQYPAFSLRKSGTPSLDRNHSSDSLGSSSSSSAPPTPLLGHAEPLIHAFEDEEEILQPRARGKLHVIGELPSPDVSPQKIRPEASEYNNHATV